MANHVFTGVFIPAKLWLSKDLIPQEKMILAEIRALSEESGWCYANNSHFSEWLGCLPTNVSNYIQKFQKSGIVEVIYKDKKTFAGRKMRVNAQWYHELSTPSIPTVPPSIPTVPPSIPTVTEIHFKDTFKLNERGDTTAPEFSNLQSKKTDSGTKHFENFEVTAITRVATTIEAEQKIIEWAALGGIEIVRQRHNLAMRRFKDEDMPALAAHYCSVYTKNAANKERLLKDPVTHFSDGLFSYLKNEESFGRNNAPKEGGATRQTPPLNYTSQTRH